MTTTTAQYLFESSSNTPSSFKHQCKSSQRSRERRSDDRSNSHPCHSLDDDADGSASLTYSTTSSVNSWSVADESHDSSFADMMRVLDVHDGKGLASFLKQDDCVRKNRQDKSSAESLAYSTDNESHDMRSHATDNESALHGTILLTSLYDVGYVDVWASDIMGVGECESRFSQQFFSQQSFR
jgi:hypothetical protein